jgi:hypothetical protein
MPDVIRQSARCFDAAHRGWESAPTRKALASLLIVVFLTSLVAIEAGRRNFLPVPIAAMVPRSHFFAISVAFTVLLYLEVIDLVFGMSRSFSKSVGKQFEIFSLILLRQSFKDFTGLPEPLQWPASPEPVASILTNGVGALAIFAVLFLYYRVLYHQPITQSERETAGFIRAKKTVAMVLLGFFVIDGLRHLLDFLLGRPTNEFFDVFYTVLVFSDILIVLISLRYTHYFPVVFRNSGFALATVLLRLALTAPAHFGAGLGLIAAVYVLGVMSVYNLMVPVQQDEDGGESTIETGGT